MKSLFAVKSYRWGWDGRAAVFCLLVLLPTLWWAIHPAANDMLRNGGEAPVPDIIGSVFQSVMMAALCLFRNERAPQCFRPALRWSIGAMLLLYFGAWIFYYQGFFNVSVVLLLSVPPCLAFVLFAWGRRNGWALMATVCFLMCHLISSVLKFL